MKTPPDAATLNALIDKLEDPVTDDENQEGADVRRWSAKMNAQGLPSFDWTAVAKALADVRAI